MIINNLKINGYFDATGIDTQTPTFSWNLKSEIRGDKQTAYKITVTDINSDVLFDSGKTSSDILYTTYNGKPLKSSSLYTVSLCVWDNFDVPCTTSKTFITGKFDCFIGKWIGNGSDKPFYARKNSKINKSIKFATAHICGLGQFKFYINGEKISNHELDPAWTNFNKSANYVTFDVTNNIKNGDNVFGVSVGNGFYIGDDTHYFYTIKSGYNPYSDMLCLFAEIHIVYDDDTTEIIATDDTWKVQKSATQIANVYGSEVFDARNYPIGWNNVDFDDTLWSNAIYTTVPKGKLTPQTSPACFVQKIYDTKEITKTGEYEYLFDLGQNMLGIFEIFVEGKAGDIVDIKPVEKLTADGKAHETTPTHITYTLKGDKIESFKPSFSAIGGRWVQVSGVTRDKADNEKPYIHDVKGHFVTSLSDNISTFSCSDKRYEQIHYIILKAIESNLIHVHSDCPTIEKLGWLETAQLMAPSVMYNKDVHELWAKICRDMQEAQYENGLVPDIAPAYAKFGGSFWDSPAWGVACVLAPFFIHKFYNDDEIIIKNLDTMVKYLEYLKSKENENGFLVHGLGDWGIEQNKGESIENVETSIYYYGVACLYEMLVELSSKDKLSQKDLLPYYKNEIDRIKNNYNEKLLVKNPDTNLWCYKALDTEGLKVTQANQAMPLYFDMVPQDKRSEVYKSFMQSVSDHQIRSGEIGLRFILMTLAQSGEHSIIHDMIMQKEHPSYYRFVEMGETTLPEFWRDDARSRNHDMMGHVMEWFFHDVCGIQIDSQGEYKIKIAPAIFENLDFASCSFNSVFGNISSSYKRSDTLTIDISIPANTSALVRIPYADNIYMGEDIVFSYGKQTNTEFVKFHSLETILNGDKFVWFVVKSGIYSFTIKY